MIHRLFGFQCVYVVLYCHAVVMSLANINFQKPIVTHVHVHMYIMRALLIYPLWLVSTPRVIVMAVLC